MGAGVSKELLHQHPHTAGTVVAAGESPANGKYGGGGMAGVVVGGALVRTVEEVDIGEVPWLVRRHLLDWSVRHIDAVENVRLRAEFDCKGEVGAFWVKEDPLAADARRARCFAPNCGKSCVFICSGCKEASYCSKGCQNRDWGSTFGHCHQGECGRRYKYNKGGEFRAIVKSSRPPPLIRCNWLRGSRSFANICWNQGCGRAGKFSCNGWSCNLKGRQFFYCSSRCHKAEVDRLVAAIVADRPRGYLKNSWEY